MKIIFLSGLYPPHSKGGGEISTSLIAEGLRGRGHSVEVITNNELPGLTDKPLLEERQSRRLADRLTKQASGVPKNAIWHAHDFRSALVLSEMIAKGTISSSQSYVTLRDYAAISGDTNNISNDGSVPENPTSVASQWTSYRIHEVGFPQNIGRFLEYILNISYRGKAISRIQNRIYISQAQRERIEPLLETAETHVIYNPIAPEFLSTPAPSKNPLSVLYVGRLEEYKGVRLLLMAWKKVSQVKPGASLTLIGTGAQEAEYKNLVEELGMQHVVTFKPHTPYEQMIQEYDKAAIVVTPHMWVEPFGRSVIEGMAREAVIVASNHGGPKELIAASSSGMLFENDSIDSLADALTKALDMKPDERKPLVAKGEDWVRSNLSQDVIAEEYEKLYQSRAEV